MGLVLDDNFGAYAIGQNSPFGSWYGVASGGQGGTIIGGPSGDPGLFPPNNFTPPATQAVLIGGIYSFVTGPAIAQGLISFSIIQTNWLGNLTPLDARNADTSGHPTAGASIFNITIEQDFSISLHTQAGLMKLAGVPSNSSVQNDVILQPNIWNFVQASFTLAVSGGNVTVALDVVINDQAAVSGTANTGIAVASLFNGTASITSVGFNSGFGNTGGAITNVTVDDNPAAGYPFPAPPPLPLARVSQGTIEFLKLPTAENARAGQLNLEYLKLPTNGNARVSQIVIELLKAPGPPPPPIGPVLTSVPVVGSPCSPTTYTPNGCDQGLCEKANLWAWIRKHGGTKSCCRIPELGSPIWDESPWRVMPSQGEAFTTMFSQPLTAFQDGGGNFTGLDVVLGQFIVPCGWDGVLNRVICGFTGSGFQDFSGQIVWRVLVNARFARNLGNIKNSFGSFKTAFRVPGTWAFRLVSGQTVTVIASIPPGSPVVDGVVTGGAIGWVYPRR